MKHVIRTLVLAAAVLLLMSSCSAKKEAAHQAADTGMQPITIAAGDFYEACDMEKAWIPGSRLNVTFTSSAPVEFNVHYHEKHAKMYAVEQTVAAEFAGSFMVQGEGIHCAMWKNDNPQDVTLTYEISVAKQ